MTPLRLAFTASDPITHDGVTAYLGACPQIRLLPGPQLVGAEACLIMATDVNARTMTVMERLGRESAHPEVPLVLVADSISEIHLVRAIGYGLVSFLPRPEVRLDEVVRALVESRAGRTEIPPGMVRTLVEQIRHVQRTSSAPGDGCLRTDLTRREIEVLALVAEGLSTAEVSVKLNYAERTIKSILYGAISRLNLRNRTHAVAYAVRAGVI